MKRRYAIRGEASFALREQCEKRCKWNNGWFWWSLIGNKNAQEEILHRIRVSTFIAIANSQHLLELENGAFVLQLQFKTREQFFSGIAMTTQNEFSVLVEIAGVHAEIGTRLQLSGD